MTNLNISVSNKQNLFEIKENEIADLCKIMMDFALKNTSLPEEFEDIKSINFDLVFCDNKTIQEINSQYRGKHTPTDVITFSLFFDDENKIILDGQIHLGEIIISTQKTAIQAKENNHSFKKELLFLLSHGILHLLGLDHPNDESLQSMLKLQQKMVKEITNDKI